MCGITAVLTLAGRSSTLHGHSRARKENHKPTAPVVNGHSKIQNGQECSLRQQVDKALEYINHRGPDYSGSWASDDGSTAMGNARLEINDLTPSGHQPFQSPSKTIQAVVNGEVYNHKELRAEILSKMPYDFTGRSDCESVVALYQYYGIGFLSRLNGEYAICIYDSERKLLIAARDRSGVKPLYWTIVDGRLLVASEAKAFLPLGWQPEWDVGSIVDGGWNTDTRTLFRAVQKIPPGQYLTCVAHEHIDIKSYWELDYPHKTTKETRTEQQMIEDVRSRLMESVRLRLQADVPVGIFLSGGIDSSAIAGMAKHLLETNQIKLGADQGRVKQLLCLGIGFAGSSGYDESEIAARTAKHLGLEYRKQYVDEEDLAAHFEDAVWNSEQHYFDLGFVAKHALSKLAHEVGLKVILNGQGADEFLGGYPAFLPAFLSESDPSWPHSTIPEKTRQEKFQEALKSAGPEKPTFEQAPTLMHHTSEHVPVPNYVEVYAQIRFADWTGCYGTTSPYLTMSENTNERVRELMRTKWHPLNSALYSWYRTNLPNLLLTCIGDRTEMSHSIEGRTPFLDHNLVEYVNGIPPSLKIRYNSERDTLVEKWILREASKPFITEELYERKKHPFSSPSVHPIGGPLHQLMCRLITAETIDALGFLDWEPTRALVDKAFESQDGILMGTVYVVAQWVVLSQRLGIRRAQKPEFL